MVIRMRQPANANKILLAKLCVKINVCKHRLCCNVRQRNWSRLTSATAGHVAAEEARLAAERNTFD